jgi:hypothetical protein
MRKPGWRAKRDGAKVAIWHLIRDQHDALVNEAVGDMAYQKDSVLALVEKMTERFDAAREDCAAKAQLFAETVTVFLVQNRIEEASTPKSEDDRSGILTRFR